MNKIPFYVGFSGSQIGLTEKQRAQTIATLTALQYNMPHHEIVGCSMRFQGADNEFYKICEQMNIPFFVVRCHSSIRHSESENHSNSEKIKSIAVARIDLVNKSDFFIACPLDQYDEKSETALNLKECLRRSIPVVVF